MAVLTAAFVLGRPVPRRSIEAALPALGVAGGVRLGLLKAVGAGAEDDVRALGDLRPYAAVDAGGAADLWVVSEGKVAMGGPLRQDHVLEVGGPR